MDNGIPIRSLSRGIAVLQAINRDGSATLTDIAKTCRLPFPTVSRLVQSLLHEGLIEREPNRRHYRPTALVQTLAHGFQGDARLVKAARPHIVELTRMVGWPITLSTHVGHSMVIRDSTHALSALTFNEYFPGYASPLLETASGLIFLASIDDAKRAALVASLRVLENSEWAHAVGQIEDDGFIAQVRRQGYTTRSFNRFTRNPGKTSSLAAAVFEGEQPAGAISLAFFASAMKMEDAVERFAELVLTCAAAISAELSTGRPAAPSGETAPARA
ncbi:helix-turn-helix domain-containing protein [Novosphingobium soli]|uniref:Helix-turn-helix domain-containing protein n=1 Tax=Novosphingobium soli TaxID=574956 RepID=A0ABV6CV38_9SPHN